MPGIDLSTLLILTHLLLIKMLWTRYYCNPHFTDPVAQMVKTLPAMQETRV